VQGRGSAGLAFIQVLAQVIANHDTVLLVLGIIAFWFNGDWSSIAGLRQKLLRGCMEFGTFQQ
jgi:hypothetical protein